MKSLTTVATLLILPVLAGCTTSSFVLADGSECGGDVQVVLDIQMGNETGQIEATMFISLVPTTAGNFVRLLESGYYDDTPMHRAMRDFMVQGGDPSGTGAGGEAHEDYADDRGNIPDEFEASLRHEGKGTFSMANAGPGTGSSQFFITFTATPWLDNRHAVFGQVTDGFDFLDRINEEAGRPSGDGRNGVPPLKPLTFVGGTASCL